MDFGSFGWIADEAALDENAWSEDASKDVEAVAFDAAVDAAEAGEALGVDGGGEGDVFGVAFVAAAHAEVRFLEGLVGIGGACGGEGEGFEACG